MIDLRTNDWPDVSQYFSILGSPFFHDLSQFSVFRLPKAQVAIQPKPLLSVQAKEKDCWQKQGLLSF